MKKIIITGNVGRDPEAKADQAGTQFATFSVGVSVGNKQNPKTDWVDVSCNGKLVDIVMSYVKKGSKVLIEGYPTAHAYINKENKPVGSLRIYANTVELLTKKDEMEQEPTEHFTPSDYAAKKNGSNTMQSTLNSDNIPF